MVTAPGRRRRAAALALAAALASAAAVRAAVSVADAERLYERARFAKDQLELTSARGAPESEAGVALAALVERFARAQEAARAALASARAENEEDERALGAMRAALALELAAPAAGAAPETAPDCAGDLVAQAGGGDDPAPLSALLYRCYGARATAIAFEGETTDRLSILARLRAEPDRERRRKLFEALLPLGRIVDGDGGAASPYRELVRRTAAAWRRDGSPIDRQLVALGLDPAAFEAALVALLEAWRGLEGASGALPLEPWDLHYSTAEASRAFASALPPERIEAIARRVYADLGADPGPLGVRLDLAPRPGKTPVAFTTFGERRRSEDGVVLPTVPWIFATYRAGGFDNLVELLHELGHAVHIAAIDTRPAFLDWPDLDAFSEALGDLVALDAYEPEWQARYLGRALPLPVAIRSKYGAIALDAVWALFEIRIHRDPSLVPNRLWSELAARYLGVAPHPEWSWWMLRGQLVSNPGYMANYAIGALIAADLRARALSLHGPFFAGDRLWYRRLAESLYRSGRARPSRAVIEGFLGRPLGADALLADLARGRGAEGGAISRWGITFVREIARLPRPPSPHGSSPQGPALRRENGDGHPSRRRRGWFGPGAEKGAGPRSLPLRCAKPSSEEPCGAAGRSAAPLQMIGQQRAVVAPSFSSSFRRAGSAALPALRRRRGRGPSTCRARRRSRRGSSPRPASPRTPGSRAARSCGARGSSSRPRRTPRRGS